MSRDLKKWCNLSLLIQALESLDQLVYICQSDSSSTVRRRAKEALFSLGEFHSGLP